MDHEKVGRFWNANADSWTKLARAGYDVYRDYLNTPAFFDMLPNVAGLAGLDIGCGEGHNTRLLAKCGAQVTAIDIAENSLRTPDKWRHTSHWTSLIASPALWTSLLPKVPLTSPRLS